MKTLASSFSKITLHRNGDRPFFSSGELRHEIRIFQSKKLARNVGFCLCAKHEPVCTTRVSSSLSPESQVDLGTGDDQNQETNESKTVRVKFQLQKECSFGEQFTIVGDDPLLGLWDPESVIPLNWSDEHLWTVELDIPAGKSFQFKFILKGIGGKIWWQPGPDRILQTWETDNTIVVWEDWEDAALQKVTEEEPSADRTEEPTVNPEMLIVTENLTPQKEKLVSEASNGGVAMNVSANPEKKPAPVTSEKRIVADNISPTQEKPVAIVADNRRYSKGPSAVNEEEQRTTSNKSTLIREDVVRNDDAPTVINSAKSDVQGSVVAHEGDPVPVPDLPAVSALPSEAAIDNEGERNRAIYTSVGINEVENHNFQELDEKHEIGDKPPGEETVNGFIDEEQHDYGFIYKPLGQEEKKQEMIRNSIVQNDLHWIKKLLANLGFL
ncbi:ALPHA-AMYLASE [Salix koriyanagi]|uniref:ALPHA-AMYLASE n=1 Tax=Salix koriyanagi TaxID=2511006 RepID=A0A9Q0ZUB5_9ROSI|nr:ALPHA-AMYLASE [Salix koriyanagi]